MTLQLAILASGSGTNAQAMFQAARRGRLDAHIRLVLCNRPGAGVIERAAAFGVPCRVLDHTRRTDRAAYDMALADAVREAGADTVALAGYMRMLGPAFTEAFPGRVLNIHPALLPAFPGVRGIGDALARGVRIAGCTVHFVDEIMDHGPIIIQAAVPHLPGESEDALAARIHRQEHRIYPQALQWLAEERLERYDLENAPGRGVRLLPRRAGRAAASAPEASVRGEAPDDGGAGERDVLISPPLEAGF